MGADIRGQSNSSTEAENDTQGIKGNVDDGHAKAVDEGRGQEVQQGEEPPYADEERVVDDGVSAVVGTSNVVAHEGCDDEGADELGRS